MTKRLSCPHCGSINLRFPKRAGSAYCDHCKVTFSKSDAVFRDANPNGQTNRYKVPSCPHCNGLNLARYPLTRTYRCHTCAAGFPEREAIMRERPEHRGGVPKGHKRRAAGSGVIAGKITIPQYRWGSAKW